MPATEQKESALGQRYLSVLYFLLMLMWSLECLQCFDAVGWAAGRASGL